MKAVLQRVSRAGVTIDGVQGGKIEKGLVVLLGIGENDTKAQADFLVDKIANLRIFEDENGKMNFSLLDVCGELLVVPNFTIYSDCRKGRRPFFAGGAKPAEATLLFDSFMDTARNKNIDKVEQGKFGSDMQVELVNDGPITIILDTDEIMKKC